MVRRAFVSQQEFLLSNMEIGNVSVFLSDGSGVRCSIVLSLGMAAWLTEKHRLWSQGSPQISGKSFDGYVAKVF
jgi:hypothetical protein